MDIIRVILFGVMSDVIMSSKEGCIQAERSNGAFILMRNETLIAYYYENQKGDYEMKCSIKNYTCILKNFYGYDSNEIIDMPFDKDSNNKKFSRRYGHLNYQNDRIQINYPYYEPCIYSKSYCILNGTYIVWHVDKCVNFTIIGEINTEIWTTNKPLTKFVLIPTGPPYVLQLLDEINFNKSCLTNIRRTDYNDIFIQPTSKLNSYWHEDLTKYKVSKNCKVFCEAKYEKITNNLNAYFITLISIILIIAILSIVTFIKLFTNSREHKKYLKIILQNLNNTGAEKNTNNFEKIRNNGLGKLVKFSCSKSQENVTIVENSLYSS